MRARIVAFISFLLLGASAIPSLGQTGDPKKDAKKPPEKITADTEINGKTLEQWIALISNPDRSHTEQAIQSILLYPPELAQRAVPVMVAELNKHTSVASIDLSVRVNCPPALAIILSRLSNPDPTYVKDTVAAIRKMLKDPQIIVKFRATQAVAHLGPLAKDATAELHKLARDLDTWETRHAAVVALGTTNFDANPKAVAPQPVVDTLYAALKDPASRVRLAALQALDNLRVGQSASLKTGFQTRLEAMAKDDREPGCRLRAQASLFLLQPTPAEKKKRLEAIGKYLESPHAPVRIEAAQTLGELGEEAKDQSPRLIKLLSDKDQTVMGWAIWALGNIRDRGALSYLRDIADDANVPQAYRDTAREAIDTINGGPAKKKDDTKKRQ